MRKHILIVIALTFILSAHSVLAAAPQMINYQGNLTSGGEPVDDGSYAMEFRIYNSSGVEVWMESHDVDVSGGQFSVMLGSNGSPITDGLFSSDEMYLGIKVGDNAEIDPRTRLVTSPYAFRVSTVDGATGGTISGDVAIQSDLDLDGDIRVTGKATIGPGHTNTGTYSFVAGEGSTVSGVRSTIGGGGWQLAEGSYTTIGGGRENHTDGNYSTIAGGRYNVATDNGATVGGGINDSALGYFATVAGGNLNVAKGDYTAIGGGRYNSAGGNYSAILGGFADTISISASYSYLFGIGSKLTQDSTLMVDMPHIRFGDEATGYEFPADDGSADQVMATDGNGQLSWVDMAGGGGWVKSGSVVRLNTSTDNVGIGTASPGGHKLSLQSSASGLAGTTIYSENQHSSGIAFFCKTTNSSDATMVVSQHGTGDIIRGFNSSGNHVFHVTNCGKVITPVVEITGGCDLAEPFDVGGGELIEPGMLVCIDPDHPGKLKLSDKPYDYLVAGVLSGAGGINPGLTLSQQDLFEGGRHVALTGRVYAKVDASYGSIKPGDFLTTSPTPGYAMKATDRKRAYGAVIGKAMTGLKDGQGLVLVLVNLQ